ncbi:UNVERIFIED_ORG: hypothetical protein ABID75_006187 [Bacillus proteolyticus]|uniref:hypothetical protein n=1 Tax=Bacillus cereus TaxID=1396 RepID=UPI000BFC093D|nr:hypothetical protein [Bacillus cereus]PGN30835.1 hypothetical protein CN960_28860 [Bacillus cereus]
MDDFFLIEDYNGRHPRAPIPNGPYIDVFFWASTNANIGNRGSRIKEHNKIAEGIFLQCGKDLFIRHVWYPGPYGTTDNVTITAESIDRSLPIPDEIIKVKDSMRGYFPEINVFIAYIGGEFFKRSGAPTQTVGVSFDDSNANPCYVILITDKAAPFILAHEIGHVLNFSNKQGKVDDPNPIPGDPSHDRDSNNLMNAIPVAGSVLTQAQCALFFDSKIIKNNI